MKTSIIILENMYFSISKEIKREEKN